MTNKYPAKFIGRVYKRFDDGWTTLSYEYRGKIYLVDIPHNGYTAYVPQKVQHQQEQAKIDAMIEAENEPATEYPKQTYKGSWEEGFDLFWNYIHGDA